MRRKKLKLQTSKTAKRRRKKRVLKITFYVFSFLLIIFGFSFLSFADFINIQNISVKGAISLNKEAVTSIFDKKTKSNLLVIFSRTNIFLYPHSAIKAEILNSYDSISRVDISRINLRSIEITLQERKPFGLWCSVLAPSHNILKDSFEDPKGSQEKCFYLDEDGYIFDQAADIQEFSFIRHYGDLLKKENGDYFLEPPNFKKIHNFASSIFSFFDVETAKIQKKSDKIEILLDNGTILFISERDDLEKTFESLLLLTVEDQLKTGAEKGNQLDVFEHIDLRFGNKILYKLKSKE